MERPLERVVIVGSGNLAEALAQAVARSGLQLVQLFARNAARGEAVAALAGTQWTADPARLADADIYLISVSDKAVGEVAAALPLPAGAVVAHTAGSVPLDALPAHARRAVFYPLQTFTKGRSVYFSQIPLFLETDDESLRPALEAFARRLSHTVVWADSACRAKVHLAAVFACNFVNHMYAVGEGIVRSAACPSTYSNRSWPRPLPRRSTPPPRPTCRQAPPCATTCTRWHATVHCSPPTPDSKTSTR